MDFFASQDTSRKKTKWLVGYFLCAVAGLVASLYLVVITTQNMMSSYVNESPNRHSSSYQVKPKRPKAWTWWDPTVFLWSSLGTLSVILLGSGYKSLQLSGGGGVVATDLGGRLIDRNTTDTDEKRLLNVVEEMAIAAGMPVPDVYMLDHEDGINAFAAGRTPGDAVIGVTRGCVRNLTRDELQGVMAHEFSHILNGDMRLNLRLIGLIHGILIIAILGRMALRMAMEARGNSSGKGGDARLAVAVIGGAIMAIGYLGVLFGHLIKAAISRQREFLADASAVQFTRNSDGIAGALMKIGGLSRSSFLTTPMAEEASHMMFGACISSSFFASHPPLHERILRVAPHWNGEFPKTRQAAIKSSLPVVSPEPVRHVVGEGPMTAGFAALAQAMSPEANREHLDLQHAGKLQASMPAEWRPLLTNPAGAQAMMFAVMLSEEPELLEVEMLTLSNSIDEDTLAVTLRQHQKMHGCTSAMLLAVVDLAIPALRRLSPDEYDRFASILNQLMSSDKKIDLFEFSVQKILRRHLDLYFRKVRPPQVKFATLNQLPAETHGVISLLACVAGKNSGEVQAAFDSGAAVLKEHGMSLPAEILSINWESLDRALDQLERLAPLAKKQLLYACGKTVMADGLVINEEAELLRAVADTIGCPIPHFVSLM